MPGADKIGAAMRSHHGHGESKGHAPTGGAH
jgi:hypothetical protein